MVKEIFEVDTPIFNEGDIIICKDCMVPLEYIIGGIQEDEYYMTDLKASLPITNQNLFKKIGSIK